METRGILVSIALALLLAGVASAGPTSTITTTTTTTTATLPTSTTITTTTTTPVDIQCRLRTGTCGPFENCQVLSPLECSSAGGINVGPGDCSAPPTVPPSTTPPSACCTPSTPGGPFDQCTFTGLCECVLLLGGNFIPFNSCTPNICEIIASTTTVPTVTTTTVPPDGRVAICHKGLGTLFVDASALRGHLGHGDAQGACPAR